MMGNFRNFSVSVDLLFLAFLPARASIGSSSQSTPVPYRAFLFHVEEKSPIKIKSRRTQHQRLIFTSNAL
jgi:hypothetical protein